MSTPDHNQHLAKGRFAPEGKEMLDTRTPIIIAGLPGKMATLVVEAVQKSNNYVLVPRAISTSSHKWEQKKFGDTNIILRPFSSKDLVEESTIYNGLIAVDYTVPSAVNANAELYADAGVPFVMGTTGGDRQKLIETVKDSEICAVIAPNMAPQIVMMQALIEKAAEEFPGALNGWRLSIVESHQTTKKDVSGTAKAWLPKFEDLGTSLDGRIQSIRDPEKQITLGIENLTGHGYHWFTLTSPDGKASLKIFTAVEGRSPYVDGTLMAVKFLEEKIKAGEKGQVFSMVDVLRAQSIK